MNMNITPTSNSIPQGPTSPASQRFSFWGNLPLSRKLLLAFGVLFIFAVIIAIVTLQGLSRTQTAYEDTLTQGIEIRRLSDQVEINLLRARRDGKDFLLRWRSQGYDTAYANYVPLYRNDVLAMREYIKQLAPFGSVAATASTGAVSQAQYEADLVTLNQNTDTYENSLLALAASAQKRGTDINTGLEGAMRTAAETVEAKITGKAGLEQLMIILLQTRRAEKEYKERDQQPDEEVYIDRVHTLVPQLKTKISETDQLDAALKSELTAQMDAYLTAFDAIVIADQEISDHDAELADAARVLEASVTKIEKLGETLAADAVSTARTNSSQTFTFSMITVFIVLLISIALAITLSRQITQPIIRLTTTAQQISEGDFTVQAEVSSADEVGTLATTFNLMTGRLGKAFEDVRRRSLAVQTSAEVSQRLSMATNPRQLAVEVVEQVQAAFNYYHAHIYFLDETSGDLIMAGGTGEAGAKLLASGHRIPKGRGLVGRAAATNAPVLVPDVSKAIGWLPNALLPDTKSEVAIPISSGKQVLGVLDVQQNVINGLGEEDVTLLQSLAGQVAISLQNARAFEQSQSQAELETLVNTIGQKIQRAATVEDTLQTAIREIALALGASRVSANIQANRQNDGNNASQN
jgi:putative methionine-R-sulfoxide reductase with GAF domain